MKHRKVPLRAAVAVTVLSFAWGSRDVLAAPLAPIPVVPGTPAIEVLPRSYLPNMTRMPESHVIAAFALTQNGQALYIDTHGTVIGRADPVSHTVLWSGSSPTLLRLSQPQPHVTFRGP